MVDQEVVISARITGIVDSITVNTTAATTELEARGHRYRTHSDTETIVHAYEEWGDDCVQYFRGMFAFAIWDAPRSATSGCSTAWSAG